MVEQKVFDFRAEKSEYMELALELTVVAAFREIMEYRLGEEKPKTMDEVKNRLNLEIKGLYDALDVETNYIAQRYAERYLNKEN